MTSVSAQITIDTSQLQAKMRAIKNTTAQAMPQIYAKFVQVTPRRHGNARNSTYLSGKTIQAQYPYASVLDAGRGFRDGQMRGSDQAPDGMVRPTTIFAQSLITRLIQQIGQR